MENLFNAKLKVVGNNETAFYDILKLADSMKVGDVKLDYKINEGSRFGGVINGLGIIQAGRSLDISIPVLYKNQQLDTVGIVKQINEILSLVSQSYNNKYYLIYEFDNELYSCEMVLVQAGGYSVKSILDAGSITLRLNQLNNFFTSEYDTERKIEILEGSGTKHTQDIELNIDDTYTPTLCDFKFIMDINVSPFYLYFANRDNYGISCSIDSLGILKDAVVEYKDNMLLINGIAYDYDGVQFMFNRGSNILFYESNAVAKDCRIFYKKSILI